MPVGVSDSFPSNAVHLIANYRMQGTRNSFHGDTIISCNWKCEVPGDTGKSLVKSLHLLGRRSQAANRFSPVINYMSKEVDNADYLGFHR